MAEPYRSPLRIVKLASAELPKIVENKSQDWVMFGQGNDYRSYLIKLFQKSAKHNAIVSGKVDYVMGNGWRLEQPGTISKLITRPNKDATLEELLSKIALDYELFNGFALEIIWDRMGRFASMYHVPFQFVCPNKDLTRFYYTRNWKLSNIKNNDDYADWPPYNPAYRSGKQLFYFFETPPSNEKYCIYPYPDYIGAIPYIELDGRIADFHLSNIQNSFWGSFLINLYGGQPGTEEEEREVERQFKRKFAGEDSAGQFVINFADSKERGAEILPLNTPKFDELFNTLNQTVRQEIFIGHKVVNPIIFGEQVAGKLGGRNEMREAYELFKNTYVNSRQRAIENVFNELANELGFTGKISIEPTEPIRAEVDVTETTLNTALSKNEIRKYLSKTYGVELDPVGPSPTPAAGGAPTPPQQGGTPPVTMLEKFKAAGVPRKQMKILRSRVMDFRADDDVEMRLLNREFKLMQMQFAKPLSGTVSPLEVSVLKVLDANPGATPEGIAHALDKNIQDIEKTLDLLVAGGYLEQEGRKLLITDTGDSILPPVEPDEETNIEIMYSYDKAPWADGATILPTSRDFCKHMVELDSLWTRDNIQLISNEEDYNVWLYRGGWYHNPDTDENQPYCRHIWTAHVVQKTKTKDGITIKVKAVKEPRTFRLFGKEITIK